MNESYFNYYASSRRAIAEAMGQLSTVESKFTIRFKNYDGSILQTVYAGLKQPVAYTGETPIRPEDEQYIYTFKGWDKEIVKATKDEVYTATFDAEEKKPQMEWVDLGLPSGKLWAKYNLGANSETELGNYYQWAGTTPLTISGGQVIPANTYDTAPYYLSGDEGVAEYSKYNSNGDVLELSDDVANIELGTGFMIPSISDFNELINETDNENTTVNGVHGWKFMKKSDHNIYIFLPAAGFYINGAEQLPVDEGGVYQTNQLAEGYLSKHGFQYLIFNIEYDYCYVDDEGKERWAGVPIRPVYDPS